MTYTGSRVRKYEEWGLPSLHYFYSTEVCEYSSFILFVANGDRKVKVILYFGHTVVRNS